MMIKVLYMSKNATTRHHTKSDFAVTYLFGHISCISGPFLFKIGSKCVDFWGVLKTSCNQLKLVWLHLVLGSFSFWKSCNHNQQSDCIQLQSSPVAIFFQSMQPDLQTPPFSQGFLQILLLCNQRPIANSCKSSSVWFFYQSIGLDLWTLNKILSRYKQLSTGSCDKSPDHHLIWPEKWEK